MIVSSVLQIRLAPSVVQGTILMVITVVRFALIHLRVVGYVVFLVAMTVLLTTSSTILYVSIVLPTFKGVHFVSVRVCVCHVRMGFT